jgi:hypothetical protein
MMDRADVEERLAQPPTQEPRVATSAGEHRVAITASP